MSRVGLVLAIAAALASGCGKDARPTGGNPYGLPALDRPWTVREQAEAAAIVTDLCERGATTMPAFGSPAFSRLVDASNRTTLVASPLPARHDAITAHTAALLEIYTAYFACGRLPEALAANAALLEGYAESLAVGRAMRDAAAPDSPERASRQAGLDQMIAGLDGGIASTVAMLGDVEIPGDVPPAIGQRLGAAIAAVRAELPAGLLDDSIATLRQAATAVTDPERRRAVAAAAAALD
jgi:hypothetical protein